ncbi:hypothetical protein Lbir_0263 [Legionella birminghamensis]|uniref:Signal transduction histidine kinase n=1 Tax=Legionella birminghamensis TaxID=28083 RepID=A0A378IBL9_9GAMM|nr:cache domain-containing protein [Legionella birminghamensis]KTC76194.1 hypothetical protein Lbir_0263 [Legionella birminghamensis]STX32182.1 Signal transduction histidine kinase [Legionella birminghamensis]
MSVNLILCIYSFLTFVLFPAYVSAGANSINWNKNKVIERVKKAENHVAHHGKENAILEFRKKSSRIFAINFDGIVLASPIHPETVGTNQINFKDQTGVFAVREEIEKAKIGGGWLKGRYRKNHITGNYGCRKLYIHPMPGNYFIGSWYYYPATKKGNCEF